ncbi:TPA: lytic transglycosylase domain-containing protein, partial [Escherichia coli]|nr:lytic transglycosylase domain-containing protein [Escherichia coli]
MANYRDLLEQAGARYGVPEGLMTALGAKESSYNPAAVSSAGAVGLTQVMPGTWRDMGYTDEQMQNPEYQADAGARYLAKMYQQFGNWRDALQAYHDGPGNVMKAKRGEYTPGPEGRGYVDDRFAQWAGDPVTDSTVEQRATSAKVHPQQDPNNPFAQLEAQSSEQVSASGVQSDPNNPFAQIEQQAASQQPPQPVSYVAPKPVQQQGGIMSDLGNGLAETGRGLLQAGINVANIPAELTDAVTSAAAWAGGKLGIGDGTYQPAPRVTTQGLEQDFGLQQGALTPQTTEGRVFAEALPYLTPAGVERAATQAPTLAGRIAQGATRLLAENAVGSLAANSAKDDAEALATDLGVGVLIGGAINAAGRGLGAAYRGVRGAIAPEAQQAIRFAEREGVPLHTTDLLQPTSRVGKMAQTTAENIPLAGTSGMRATQQEARSQLVQRFADKFGEYDPSVVIDSLKAKTSGIRRAAGNRLEQVQNAMAGVNIQPARAIQQIDTEISNLQKLGKVADNETISKLQSYRDELVRNAGPDGPVNLDLKQLSDLRSQFRMDVKGERPVLPNRSDAAIQRVYKAMT